MARLREMGDRQAEAEIALHLRVVDGDETVVEAADVGDNEIWVSSRLSADAVAAMRRALVGGLDVGGAES